MGEVIETPQTSDDMESEDSLIQQVQSYDEPEADMRFPLDDEVVPEEREETQAPEPEESIQETSTQEPTYEVPDGKGGTREVTTAQILEWEAGHMKDADYRRKTGEVADMKRQLEEVYGPAESPRPSYMKDMGPEPEITDPYDQAQIVDATEFRMRKILDERDQQNIEAAKKVRFNEVYTQDWDRLQQEFPDLQNNDSLLYKTANGILSADRGLATSPLQNRYAVNEAIRVLGPTYKAQARVEGAREVVQTLGQPKAIAPTPSGGSGAGAPSELEDLLSPEEQRLIKMPTHRAATLSGNRWNKREAALDKLDRARMA